MSIFRHIPILLLYAASYARAQTQISSAPPPTDKIEHLDRFVVSAGPDPKTTFDLAQGTSVLVGDDLRRAAHATLGDTLAGTPGVSSTSYGPGASRPVIRGLGGDRIRILDNGVGALDASNISPDHNTALEPLFATRIEVLRGPSTLLYGSSAVGGVVNVIDNRIPAMAPAQPITGTIEVRGFGAADERAAVATLTAGTKALAVQINGLRRRTGDVRIPGVARIDDDAPASQPPGTLPNSEIDSKSGSIGASYFGAGGFLGIAASTYSTTYGVPTDEPISIVMHQRRLDLQGETTTKAGFLRGMRARFGLGDYEHSEVADRAMVNTTFTNQAWEARLELPHAFGSDTSGNIGVQAARSAFSAVGEEVVTPSSVTTSQALFLLEEWKLEGWRLEAGARVERQAAKLGDVDPALPAVPGYTARSGEKRTDTGVSTSLGAVFYPAKDWSIGLNVAYSERLPTAQERFSNGPHGGTGAWEVGTAGLGREKSLGFDLNLRKRSGFVTGTLGVFMNRFRGYVFEQELPLSAIPEENNQEGLTPYQFVAKNARFHGGEAEITFHLVEKADHRFHVDLLADTVGATQLDDSEPLPRIPPLRLGARLNYENSRWNAGLEIRHAGSQNRVAPIETATPGYTVVNAGVGYRIVVGRATHEWFVRGTNLGDTVARVHGSFLKNFAPLAGRSITAGVRVSF